MASTLTLGVEANVTTGSANVCTRVDAPANARRFRILSRVNDAKLTFDATATDGGALASLAYETIPAGVPLEFTIPGVVGKSRNLDSAAAASNSRRFFVTSATGSTAIEVVALA